MRLAIEEARRGGAAGNIAVGSVIVLDGEVIGAGHNTAVSGGDPIDHAEIVAIRADEIDTGQLPAAAGELSAIVAATEEATHAIIGAAETIEEQSGAMPPDVAGVVTAAVTRVYEACGFQDVTGQRIAKVVDVLEEVEVRVQALLDALNEEGVSGVPPTTDEDLMGQPQARETMISQDDVDAILAGYD